MNSCIWMRYSKQLLTAFEAIYRELRMEKNEWSLGPLLSNRLFPEFPCFLRNSNRENRKNRVCCCIRKLNGGQKIGNAQNDGNGSTKCLKVISQTIWFQATERFSCRLCGGKNKAFNFVVHTAAGGATTFVYLFVKPSTLIKTRPCDDRPLISTYTQPTADPVRVGQSQRMQMTVSKISGGSMV